MRTSFSTVLTRTHEQRIARAVICLVAVSWTSGSIGQSPADAPPTQMVVAEGVGVDVESARRDAYRAAVRQVVGTLVDSQTIIENDTVITDKVVVFSDGYVDRVEPLKEVLEEGLVRVRVKAFVKTGKLKDDLRANEILLSGSAVIISDGQSLVAKALTDQERKSNAREMYLAAVGDYPASCFASKVGPPKVVEVAGGVVTCDVRIRVSVKQKEYDDFVKRLVTFLDSGGVVAHGQFNVHDPVSVAIHRKNTDDEVNTFAEIKRLLPDSEVERLQATFNRSSGVSDAVDAGYTFWEDKVLRGSYFVHRHVEPYKQLAFNNQSFLEHARDVRPVLIFVQETEADGKPRGRWFVVVVVDHKKIRLPMVTKDRTEIVIDERQGLLVASEMDCRLRIAAAGEIQAEKVIRLRHFGYSVSNPPGNGFFPAVFFLPGFRPRAGGGCGIFFEFTVQLTAPEAAFNKPGLIIEASLANVPKNTPDPACQPGNW